MKLSFFLTVIFICAACFSTAGAQTETSPPSPPEQPRVCLTQTEANTIFALAEKGKDFPKYAEKAESDIKQRDEIITNLKIELAKSVQDTINLSNQATRDNAALEQYRQYFFNRSRNKCIGLVCIQ